MKSTLIERDKNLINNWYIACSSKELKSKPISRTIYDTKMVLYRTSDGSAVAHLDRCLHRASLLSVGMVENGKLLCPYHGWAYDQKGNVTHVPSEGDQQVKGKRCVRNFPLIEREGVIWVYMGENVTDAEIKSDRLWHFPNYGKNGWAYYIMITDFDNEVTNLAENFMDVPHTVFVHKGWFRNKSLTKVPITVHTQDGGVLVTYHQEKDEIGVFIKKLLNPHNEPMKHTDHFIFPNITNVEYSFGANYKYVINSQITPISSMKSRVYTYIAYHIPVIGKILEPFIHYYTRQVIEQDVWIMKVQRPNLNPDEPNKFISTPADEPHLQIERLRLLGVNGEDVYKVEKKVETTIWI